MTLDSNVERELFVKAHALQSESERRAYLEQVCADRPELLERLETLLRVCDLPSDFLDEKIQGSTTSSETDLINGTRIDFGRYKILERIGEGGMAVVYVADQEEPIKRKVALKIIKPGMDSESVVARFEAERQALAMMDHPHIATILDGGTTDSGLPYFVMELVRGVPITDYCDLNRLDKRARLELMILVCYAVQHAHQKGIIHRDLKPSNILVTLRDGKPIPKVIDFGISKAIQGRLTDKTLFTRFQMFVGTPAYMSPEQAQMTASDVDTRADVYALGAVLYELLTGHTPFEPSQLTTLEDCRRVILEEEPARPSQRVSSLHHEALTTVASWRRTEIPQLIYLLQTDLDWIAMKCLEKDRTRRYETVVSLAQDIRRYLDGEAIEARPPSLYYRMRKFTNRHRVAVFVGSVIFIASILSTWQAIRATLAVWEQNRLRGKIETALENEEHQRQRAEADELIARQRAYNSDMNLVQHYLESNNYGHAISLLDRYRHSTNDSDLRHWEWRYLWNQSRSHAAFALPQQPEAISNITLSPDARLLATIDLNHSLKIWDLKNRVELLVQHEISAGPRLDAFSHSGAQLATVINHESQAIVKVLSIAERKVVKEFACPRRVQAVAFTPDDKEIVLVGDDLSVMRWSASKNQLSNASVARGNQRPKAHLATISADVRRLAATANDHIFVLDLDSGELLATLDGFHGGTRSLAFSNDSKLLAAGPSFASGSTDIKIFSLQSNQQLVRLSGHRSWVPSLAFNSDGSQLTSAGADQTIRIWDVEEGREDAVLIGHHSEVYCVINSPDSKQIISSGKDGSILVWDKEHTQPRKKYETLGISVRDIDFLPDGASFLSVNSDGTLSLWDSDTLEKQDLLQNLGDKARDLLLSPDGKHLYISTESGKIHYVDWTTRQPIRSVHLESHKSNRGESLALINQGRSLAVMGKSSSIRVLDSDSLETQSAFPLTTGQALCTSHGLLAVGGGHRAIDLLNLNTGKIRSIDKILPWGTSDLEFSPDGRLLATSSHEGEVNLWDTESLEPVGNFRGHLIGVNAVTFSSDGLRLASGCQGEEAVKLWDLASQQEVATLPGEGLISSTLLFSPDGRLLVGINSDGKALLWRAPSLSEIRLQELAAGSL